LSNINRKEEGHGRNQSSLSPRTTLAATGSKIRAINLLARIKEKVKIAQETIKYEPIEKLQDAAIPILAGTHGQSEINSVLAATRRR
jgi:hypothetical protein